MNRATCQAVICLAVDTPGLAISTLSISTQLTTHLRTTYIVGSRMIELSLLEHYKTILVKPLAAFSNLTMIPELLSR